MQSTRKMAFGFVQAPIVEKFSRYKHQTLFKLKPFCLLFPFVSWRSSHPFCGRLYCRTISSQVLPGRIGPVLSKYLNATRNNFDDVPGQVLNLTRGEYLLSYFRRTKKNQMYSRLGASNWLVELLLSYTCCLTAIDTSVQGCSPRHYNLLLRQNHQELWTSLLELNCFTFAAACGTITTRATTTAHEVVSSIG